MLRAWWSSAASAGLQLAHAGAGSACGAAGASAIAAAPAASRVVSQGTAKGGAGASMQLKACYSSSAWAFQHGHPSSCSNSSSGTMSKLFSSWAQTAARATATATPGQATARAGSSLQAALGSSRTSSASSSCTMVGNSSSHSSSSRGSWLGFFRQYFAGPGTVTAQSGFAVASGSTAAGQAQNAAPAARRLLGSPSLLSEQLRLAPRASPLAAPSTMATFRTAGAAAASGVHSLSSSLRQQHGPWAMTARLYHGQAPYTVRGLRKPGLREMLGNPTPYLLAVGLLGAIAYGYRWELGERERICFPGDQVQVSMGTHRHVTLPQTHEHAAIMLILSGLQWGLR